MKTVPNSKKHHYIPQYYLKGFAESPTSSKIWVYEKETGKTFRTGTINIAHENYFYALKLPDGTRNSNTYESWLANSIEGPANSVIAKIRRNELITDEEKMDLSVYIGIMHKRVPAHREEVRRLVPGVMSNLVEEINTKDISELPTQRHRETAKR